VIALALLLLPWAAALVAARRHHHLDVGIVAAVSIGLATLWVAWATMRGPKRPAAPVSGLTLGQVADQLAVAVGAQWEAEAAVCRLNDPYPLPVSWGPADESLTDSWDSLVKLATSGAGWPPPPPTGTWAVGPNDLAGQGGGLAEVLAQVPTGRLVVLGEPGAGKTMLMVRLVLDLLARRTPGGPVPFLAPVASWDPSGQDLRGWLADRLVIDHPALVTPPPSDVPEPTQAAALLASGLMLPVLDGLDEIPDHARGSAISQINDALRPGQPLVVTCRTQQYRDAVRPQSGPEVSLRAAAAVQVEPLDAVTVHEYLSDDAAGPAARARWAPVLAVLGTEAPVAKALSTPLMVGLARAIYNPRPGELTMTLRNPAELCSPALEDRKVVEFLLFDAFIPAAYRHAYGARWKVQDAEKWLVFLARHLEGTIGSPDLAWWQLRRTMSRTAVGLFLGLVFGFLLMYFAAFTSRATAMVVGGAGGFAAALAIAAQTRITRWSSTGTPVHGMRINVRIGPIGIMFVLLGSALGASLGDVGFGNAGVVVFGVVGGVIFWLMGSLEGVPSDLAEATNPQVVLARDRRAALLLMPAAGVVGGVMGGTFGGAVTLVANARAGHPADLLLGAVLGMVFGVVFGVLGVAVVSAGELGKIQAAWPSYVLTRAWLALHQRLPWRLMSFLVDAHRQGVLRQAGAVYQFRHIELQHRLANRDASAVSRHEK